MQIEFDRYARIAGDLYVDLATGADVRIVVRDVPDDDWRARWRAHVRALMDAPRGVETLVDAGEQGAHAVFEVTSLGREQSRRAGWSTADDAAYFDAFEEFDMRAGLVASPLAMPHALRHARQSGRVVLSSHLRPEAIPDDVLTRRSFVLIGNVEARWAAALARRSGRRHYMAGAPSGAVTVHEEAAPYAVDARAAVVLTKAQSLIARGRVAAAGRAAGRAMVLAANASRARADAVVIRARTLRWACRPADAAEVLDAAFSNDAGAVFLTEAAEAATDQVLLERGEAYARAALAAARSADEHRAARQALDRARVWRGESVEIDPWCARAAWHTWGEPPVWPRRGGYLHAPRGALALAEWQCDRLERAIWNGKTTQARSMAARQCRSSVKLSPLLRMRVAWLAAHAVADGHPDAARVRRVGAYGVLNTGKARIDMEMLTQLSSLLATCQDGDDLQGLTAAAAETRNLLRATSVAVYAAGRAMPIAGDGREWNGACALAERCAAMLHGAGPERDGLWTRMAVSIKTGGRPAGAIAAAWPADVAVDARRSRLLLDAAALALAPLLRAWRMAADAPPDADMPEMVGQGAAMTSVRDEVRRVARVPFPVLIHGESGVGKELVARAVHRLSPRAARPFRALNCAAMAEDLVEAELFGRAQGAYTGATTARAGLFEDADRGTIFLDEVSELSPRAQAKLLRVLQEGEVRRVGETAARRTDVRIIAASNVALADLVEAHAFRADLLFRLDVLRIIVPPLRDRPEDIPLLSAYFWREAASRAGTSAALTPDVIGRLSAWSWPGNVRELQNAIAALAVAAPTRGPVPVDALPPHLRDEGGSHPTLVDARAAFERDLVRAALARAGGRPGRAAVELGVSRQGLTKLMRRLKLSA